MSLIVKNISYLLPGGEKLFENINFSLDSGSKVSLIGNNGIGKSTLLKIISEELTPFSGEVVSPEKPYTVPQHFGQFDNLTVGNILGVDQKLEALGSILNGSVDEKDYTILEDDWDIEQRIRTELDSWGLGHISTETPFASLSGGEKTRVFLSGINLLSPTLILMDEPTNHLDRQGREKLYMMVENISSTVLVVSHDRELLEILDTTLEMTHKGITKYGGNYNFYKALHDEHLEALKNRLEDKDKSVRVAQQNARKTLERKQKLDARGEKKQIKAGVPRIMMNTLRDKAEKSSAKIKDEHINKVEAIKQEAREIRNEIISQKKLKVALQDSHLHSGKLLIETKALNFTYPNGVELWKNSLDLKIFSSDRIKIEGSNGSGKTTLLKLLMGKEVPTEGEIKKAEFKYIYVDQEYSLIDNELTLVAQLEKYNYRNLTETELKTELHRFLFPSYTWDKHCGFLSGGEKMRLMLCCLLISNDTPDMFILDEPTNNLDITSMEILTSVLRNYNGTLVVISHDNNFTEEIGVSRFLSLSDSGCFEL